MNCEKLKDEIKIELEWIERTILEIKRLKVDHRKQYPILSNLWKPIHRNNKPVTKIVKTGNTQDRLSKLFHLTPSTSNPHSPIPSQTGRVAVRTPQGDR